MVALAPLQHADAKFSSKAGASQFAGYALGLRLMVAACTGAARAVKPKSEWIVPGGYSAMIDWAEVADVDVVSALLEFHDRLVDSQLELSPEAAEVLYANLWALYE